MAEPLALEDLIKCAQRELAMRERVYPKRISEGRMKETTADHEINCMAAILHLLQEKKEPTLL